MSHRSTSGFKIQASIRHVLLVVCIVFKRVFFFQSFDFDFFHELGINHSTQKTSVYHILLIIQYLKTNHIGKLFILSNFFAIQLKVRASSSTM